MIDLNELKFDEKGLIPAVVVDAVTKDVLTVAYMNRAFGAVRGRNCGAKAKPAATCSTSCPLPPTATATRW